MLGVMSITYQIMSVSKCPNRKETIVRYIPKTLEQEFLYGEYESEIFKQMFRNPSPWVSSIGNYDRRKQEDINKYFVSQS